MPDRWLQIEELYHRVLDLDQSQRLAFLRDACAGDDALRSEVESLLMCQSEADRLMEKHAIDLAGQSLTEGVRSVSNGQQIGSYTIHGLLGAGGMGQVYHAWDSKLKRDVAIKVLPAEFWQDVKRVRRFRREAEVLASLNHPNINAIYDLEEFESSQFLVLELVNGDTLADRIARGPIPLNEALPIAKQIVEALEAAHEKGIIHRDLKPANIKITPNGNVKVLDFGLAKAFAAEGESPSLSNSPTMSALATKQGIILGTAAYMSPEQANGVEVDRRSDIFSFGAVFYEMLTGRQAFHGDTASEILAGVMKAEPDWTRLPTNTPLAIQRLLQRALRKDRSRRLQAAQDVLIEIEDANVEPDRAAAAAPSRTRERIIWSIAAVALALVGVLLTASYFDGTQLTTSRFLIELPPEATITTSQFALAAGPFPALSPDGRHLVFVANSGNVNRLWLRSMGSLTAQPLPGTEGAASAYPFWSPDSRFIGFFAGGKLKKVAVAGGPSQFLCDAPPQSQAFQLNGTWNQDDIILFAYQNTLHRVAASGGLSTSVRAPADSGDYLSFTAPFFLPDGEHFLYVAVNREPGRTEVRVGSLDSQNDKSLFASNSRVLFAHPGYILFARDGTLMAQPFDARALSLTGDIFPLAAGIAYDAATGLSAFSASNNGMLIYRTALAAATTELTWLDRSGKKVEVGVQPVVGNFQHPRLSPDENHVAVTRYDGGSGDIWLLDLLRGPSSKITLNPANDIQPFFSPDGKQIGFASNRNGRYNYYVKAATNVGTEEILQQGSDCACGGDWSPDGKLLMYPVGVSGQQDLWVLPMTGERKPSPVLNQNYSETRARFSPDGHWMLYQSDETGRPEIYVQTFPPSTEKHQVSLNGGGFAFWRGDGKEIVFDSPDGKMMAVDVKLGNTFEANIPRSLFDLPGPIIGSKFAVTKDNQKFLIPLISKSSNRLTLTTVVNWTADIPR